ncbi:MAG: glucokinase, partial [Bilophila sp.]
AALLQDSPTLRLFARFYGRMCRDWAFATLCSGGVYIAGGIAAKNPLLVTCESFAEAFVSAPSLGDWLKEVPVFLMDCETSGLWGAARHGQDCVAGRGQA